MFTYYKRNGDPYTGSETEILLAYGKDLEDKIIKQEILPNGKFISTVWLGIDMNHVFGNGKPLIFETMVFPERGNYSELDMERYSTEEEALEGHQKMVEKYNH